MHTRNDRNDETADDDDDDYDERSDRQNLNIVRLQKIIFDSYWHCVEVLRAESNARMASARARTYRIQTNVSLNGQQQYGNIMERNHNNF